MQFKEMLAEQAALGRLLCGGLDPSMRKFPKSLAGDPAEMIPKFLQPIIEATADIYGSWKPNLAFYGQYGTGGWEALKSVIRFIRGVSAAPIILDGKRTDIGDTNESYAVELFDWLGGDAITVNPYFGIESLSPFFREGKGVMFLCKTSNPGAGQFQDLDVNGKPLYLHVAASIVNDARNQGNFGLVVGATYPDDIRRVREVVGEDMPLLLPGVGKQGADPYAAVRAAINSDGAGLLLLAGSKVLHASSEDNFAEAARHAALEMNQAVHECMAEAA